MLHVRSSDSANQLLRVIPKSYHPCLWFIPAGEESPGEPAPAIACSSQKMTCVISTHNPLAKISHLSPPNCQEMISSHKHRERGKPDIGAHRMPLWWAGSKTQETGTTGTFSWMVLCGCFCSNGRSQTALKTRSLTFKSQGGNVWLAWLGSSAHHFPQVSRGQYGQ